MDRSLRWDMANHPLCSSLAVQLDHVVIEIIGRFDEPQEFRKKCGAGCGRCRQKKLAKSGNRNIARIVSHELWGTATIDDRSVENAPVFDAERIALGITEFRSRRSVRDVVHFILVNAESTDRGGGSAAGWRIILSRSGIMGNAPIVGTVPGPVPDCSGGIELLNAIVGVG